MENIWAMSNLEGGKRQEMGYIGNIKNRNKQHGNICIWMEHRDQSDDVADHVTLEVRNWRKLGEIKDWQGTGPAGVLW